MSNRLLVIVGPTAVGKSALGLELARAFDGEIVSADSRQVYRHMDIGTAKPSLEERSSVNHHLIDIIDPDDPYSLALFQRDARYAILSIKKNDRLPVMVGGSGQYVWAVIEGWQVPLVPPDPELRERLERRAEEEGPSALYDELKRLDPEAATRVDGGNTRRVVRALEVYFGTTDAGPVQRPKKPTKRNVKILGLTMNRAQLYNTIDVRVESMVAEGWIDEVQGLLDRGFSPELPALSSLGYGELVRCLRGELSLNDAVQRIKYRTHGFARRQYAWFKPADERITWYELPYQYDEVAGEIERWIRA